MKRKHVIGGEVRHIGKETKNIEEQFLQLNKPVEYIDEEELKKKILNMSPEEARKLGVRHRSTLTRWKDKIKKSEKIKLGFLIKRTLN